MPCVVNRDLVRLAEELARLKVQPSQKAGSEKSLALPPAALARLAVAGVRPN
jgi:hypothetical protein